MTNLCDIDQLIVLNHLRIPRDSLPNDLIDSIEPSHQLAYTLKHNARTSKSFSAAVSIWSEHSHPPNEADDQIEMAPRPSATFAI
jgi:hypothetical protein